jgi:hypothetical protein
MPEGPTEEHLVEELAGVLWRKRRLRLAEAATFHRELEDTFSPYEKTMKAALAYVGGANPSEVRHGAARGKMRGGFTFELSENERKARIQIKHISGRASLIQFAALRKRRDTKGDRRKQQRVPVRRGTFVDVKTVAAALFSRSFSLASLADFLQTQSRKASTDEHGGPLTADYLDYAIRDVQTTWECFCVLSTQMVGR